MSMLYPFYQLSLFTVSFIIRMLQSKFILDKGKDFKSSGTYEIRSILGHFISSSSKVLLEIQAWRAHEFLLTRV